MARAGAPETNRQIKEEIPFVSGIWEVWEMDLATGLLKKRCRFPKKQKIRRNSRTKLPDFASTLVVGLLLCAGNLRGISRWGLVVFKASWFSGIRP
ncbi:MAG: hypothetical protein ACKOEO_21175, partial [Planctomycetaceae bacterium]